MKREEIADLMAFVVVAEERSFTRAAARLSMAQSALSQIVRRIEERLGLRLLTRARAALFQLKRASIFCLFLALCCMT